MNFVQAFLVLQCQNGLKPMRRAIFSSLPPLPSHPGNTLIPWITSFCNQAEVVVRLYFLFLNRAAILSLSLSKTLLNILTVCFSGSGKLCWPFCKILSSLHVLLFVDAYLRHNTFTEDFWVVPFQYDFLLNFFSAAFLNTSTQVCLVQVYLVRNPKHGITH